MTQAKKSGKVRQKAISMMEDGYICDNCLGRGFAELLTGMSNDERGRIIRHYIAFLVDSGEKVEVDERNFHSIKFRNEQIDPEKPEKCKICKGFFSYDIENIVGDILDKLSKYEFDTFLVGTILSNDLITNEQDLWLESGIEFVEPIKTEINREVGKLIEKHTGKKANLENPDIAILIDLDRDEISLDVRSIYIYGEYQKFVRDIPQTKWLCSECNGKGCTKCDGEGKLYKTSVQEEMEIPFIKAAKARKTKFHGAGREDIDAKCLGWRPFVIELVNPRKRNMTLKRIESSVNKSDKINVRNLRKVTRDKIVEIKSARYDKTYCAEVSFVNEIDNDKLELLKEIERSTIVQKTPNRVVHRRSDIVRERKVKKLDYEQIDGKTLKLIIKGDAGLYIKELISGDEGRTDPNVSDIINNKVKNIKLDVIKIHSTK